MISETPYGFIFPADDKGTVKCNPKGGYTGKLQFYKAPTLKETQTFTVKAGCSVSHNPAIFYRAIQAVVKQEFGIFDFAAVPSGGWWVASSAALEKHKLDFISQYNNNKGIGVIKTFKSGNCCFAVKGGNKLTISNTACKCLFAC